MVIKNRNLMGSTPSKSNKTNSFRCMYPVLYFCVCSCLVVARHSVPRINHRMSRLHINILCPTVYIYDVQMSLCVFVLYIQEPVRVRQCQQGNAAVMVGHLFHQAFPLLHTTKHTSLDTGLLPSIPRAGPWRIFDVPTLVPQARYEYHGVSAMYGVCENAQYKSLVSKIVSLVLLLIILISSTLSDMSDANCCEYPIAVYVGSTYFQSTPLVLEGSPRKYGESQTVRGTTLEISFEHTQNPKAIQYAICAFAVLLKTPWRPRYVLDATYMYKPQFTYLEVCLFVPTYSDVLYSSLTVYECLLYLMCKLLNPLLSVMYLYVGTPRKPRC